VETLKNISFLKDETKRAKEVDPKLNPIKQLYPKKTKIFRIE